ncbi:MAG: hypothetical protein U0694_02100 [Anaerolineae bacterium]
MEVQTLLTYALPVLPAGASIEEASLLDLSVCREIGEGFRGMGDLTVYTESYRSIDNADTDPSSRADEVDTVRDCDTVDLTDQIQSAYEDGETQIQIRLVFSDAVNRNDQADYVLFDPRLTVTLGN